MVLNYSPRPCKRERVAKSCERKRARRSWVRVLYTLSIPSPLPSPLMEGEREYLCYQTLLTAPMTDTLNFHEIADDTLEDIFANLDANADENEIEVDLLNGVLSIKLPDGSEYIINKHEPSQQIWFSSPFSGANKFTYNESKQQWVNDLGEELLELLNIELIDLANLDVKL